MAWFDREATPECVARRDAEARRATGRKEALPRRTKTMTQVEQQPATRYDTGTGYTRIETGEGRKLFAGVMILVSATWNITDGLVANYYESVASNAGIDLPVTNTIEAFA
jgi:hypothetical protein